MADAAVAAVAGNKNVEASTLDDGKLSTVKISGGGSTSTIKQAKVDPPVPVVIQTPGTATCWAAAATMLLSWKQGKLLAFEDALKPVGDIYVMLYTNGLGLSAVQKDDFLKAAGMVSEAPASYSPSQFFAWMKKFGPLWVTTDAARDVGGFSPHAKVLVQIDGDGNDDGSNTNFTWINPSNGKTVVEGFPDFLVSYEQMVTDNKGPLFSQIVHLVDEIKDSSEGFEIEGPWNLKEPVHENITLAALIAAGIIPNTTKLNTATSETREFIRGVMWNDDPECLLFDDRTDDNWNFSSGLMWWSHYVEEKYDKENLIGRSHNYDLQFLHAMGSTVGELPDVTLAKFMLWLEIMYKVSIEDIDSTERLRDVTVSRTVDTTT